MRPSEAMEDSELRTLMRSVTATELVVERPRMRESDASVLRDPDLRAAPSPIRNG